MKRHQRLETVEQREPRPAGTDEDEDSRSEAEASLYQFVKQAWDVVESQPFVDNWHIGMLCEHLQAVTAGEIPNLLVNIPPGCSKSLLAGVFWSMWEWALNPAIRWFFASYDQRLSTRDSVKCRNLLASGWYQQRWGGNFYLRDDQNQKTYYETNWGGYRLATSIGGHGTGEHPDRVVCFPYETLVHTSAGILPIGDVVERRLDRVLVQSYDHARQGLVYRPVLSYQRHPGQELLLLRLANGTHLKLTAEHPVYVVGTGYVEAQWLALHNQVLMANSCTPVGLLSVERTFLAPEWVYNLEVEDSHNYFANGVLVHNCDDPHNVKEAESELEREAVRTWWDQTMSTRGLSRRARRVIIMQRLHTGDLSAHALASGDYVHVCLPMRYEKGRMPPSPLAKDPERAQWAQDPRQVEGDLLTPLQFPEELVAQVEKSLGTRGIAGQLQQRPVPREGNLFKAVWLAKYQFKKVPNAYEVDGDIIPAEQCWSFAVVDPAGGCSAHADYTVIGIFVVTPCNRLLLTHLDRSQTGVDEVVPHIRNVCEGRNLSYLAIESAFLQEELFTKPARKLIPVPIRSILPRGKGRGGGKLVKYIRALPVTVALEAGQLWFKAGARWWPEFETELLRFTGVEGQDEHDDIVDVLSYAVAEWERAHAGMDEEPISNPGTGYEGPCQPAAGFSRGPVANGFVR